MQLTFIPHEQEIDQLEEYRQYLKAEVTKQFENVPGTPEKIEIYAMSAYQSNINTGKRNRLVVLVNQPVHAINANTTPIKNTEGTIIATYQKTANIVNQINIVLPLHQAFNDENKALFLLIFQHVADALLQEARDASWKFTSKKEQLTQHLVYTIKTQQENYLRDDKQRLESTERDIQSYIAELKTRYDRRLRLMQNIENANSRIDAVQEKLIHDLDLIVAHEKVKDLYVENGIFKVHTTPIYAYHDRTGERYYIGNMRIEMNPQNTEVRFFGDNPRKSYWTENDPHPHVNGRSGNACLGNIGATIAELCSQTELYALTMICIDFLESVNTSDAAGRNIKNWDKVNDKGEIIEKGGQNSITWHCDECETGYTDQERQIVVYESYEGDEDGDGEWGNERHVCETCRNEQYEYIECLDAYIRIGECEITDQEEGEDY